MIVNRHLAHPLLKPRFHKSGLAAVRANVLDFFNMGTGGSAVYKGEDMKTVHTGMNLTEAEFVAVLDDALAALDAHDIDPVTRNEILGIFYSFKDEILYC